MSEPPKLTVRQQAMLDMLIAGDRIKHIAKALHIEYSTTRTYLSELYKLIGVDNKASAMAWWTEVKTTQTPNPTSSFDTEGRGKCVPETAFDEPAELHALVTLECMRLLLDSGNRAAHPYSESASELRVVNLARDWLIGGHPQAAGELEDWAAAHPAGSRMRQAALIALFFGFESRGNVHRSAGAGNALLADGIAGRPAVDDEIQWHLAPKAGTLRAPHMPYGFPAQGQGSIPL